MKDSVYVDLRNENRWLREIFNNKDLITIEEMLEKIEDLSDELEHTKEEFEDFKKDVEDNYRRLEVEEQLDISDRNFL